jgi:hypothetical protein
VSELADKILALHDALDHADLAHAFGGALALAWCTERARGTVDIDLNVFVDAARRAAEVVAALPEGVTCTEHDLTMLARDGQVRLWWDRTPLDLFLNTVDFHDRARERVRFEPFAGALVPFLSCLDLAVFKAFFNRTKDWADLEAMVEADTLDVDHVVGILSRYLGPDDERIARLRSL